MDESRLQLLLNLGSLVLLAALVVSFLTVIRAAFSV
jgi:hypothetical protein